ncbi:hypothetical protein BDZ89DRAFT_1152177 [Hymenopellis radicata]|nr:hypothetical protein BDZ89DRAFT_1152177 [Hymenopellis radicata]
MADHSKDRGWRILPSFTRAFANIKPLGVLQRLFPIVQPQAPSTGTLGNDVRMWSASRMVEYAKSHKDPGLFLDGHVPPPDGRSWEAQERPLYLRVEMVKDRVTPEVSVSVDIDSAIIVSHTPTFLCKSIPLLSAPIHRDRAPIVKHNQVYVDLLIPESEHSGDFAEGFLNRVEWNEKRFKHFQVPHMHLATYGAANMYMMCPRQTAKLPNSKYWAANISYAAKRQFWDGLLSPAIRATLPPSAHPYIGQTQRHQDYIRSNKIPRQHPVTPQEFLDIVRWIRNKIKESNGTFDRFGSFFFVYEAKGIKDYTRVSAEDGLTVAQALQRSYERFQQEFDHLDLEAASNEADGEVLLDIAFTFNPVCASGEKPLAGLWHLPYLEASYGAGGYYAGETHPLNTLDLYGGMAAEQTDETKYHSGVHFSISYLQTYQLWRKDNNIVDSFIGSDVASFTPKFQRDYRGLHSILTEASDDGVSYGVRREFRMSFQAFRKLPKEKNLNRSIRHVIHSGAILWLPLDVWCNFLACRLEAIHLLHQILYRRQPENYLIMAGLLSYLYQSVMSTPVKVPTFVTESLAHLHFGNVVSRYGMFFLQSLDVTLEETVLPEITDIDDYGVETALNVKAKRAKNRIIYGAHPPTHSERSMSWSDLKDSMENKPWNVVKVWRQPEGELLDFDNAPSESAEFIAAGIFTNFTTCMWLLLPSEFKSDPSLVSCFNIRDALVLWSVEQAYNRLLNGHFHPINVDVIGVAPGRKSKSFADRREIFFPPSSSPELVGGWATLQATYISQYRNALDGMESVEGRDRINELLGTLLSLCQCLPDSTARGPWQCQAGTHRISMVVNPTHYNVGLITNKREAGQKRARPIRRTQLPKATFLTEIVTQKYQHLTSKTIARSLRKLATLEAQAKKRAEEVAAVTADDDMANVPQTVAEDRPPHVQVESPPHTTEAAVTAEDDMANVPQTVAEDRPSHVQVESPPNTTEAQSPRHRAKTWARGRGRRHRTQSSRASSAAQSSRLGEHPTARSRSRSRGASTLSQTRGESQPAISPRLTRSRSRAAQSSPLPIMVHDVTDTISPLQSPSLQAEQFTTAEVSASTSEQETDDDKDLDYSGVSSGTDTDDRVQYSKRRRINDLYEEDSTSR